MAHNERSSVRRLAKPVPLTAPGSDLVLSAVAVRDDGDLLVDILENGAWIGTMSLYQYVTGDPYIVNELDWQAVSSLRTPQSHPIQEPVLAASKPG